MDVEFDLMHKRLSIIGLLLAGALFAFVIIFKPSMINSTFNSDVSMVMPYFSVDQIIANNALFKAYTIINPIRGDEGLIMLDVINNGVSTICVNNVLVNGSIALSESQCIEAGLTGYLNVPFMPVNQGAYAVTINYNVNGVEQSPLNLMVEARPVNQSDALRVELMVNDIDAFTGLSFTGGDSINAELTISSNSLFFVNVSRGLLLITTDGGHYFYEVIINQLIPPLQSFTKLQVLEVPRLDGEYELKAYLYVDDGALTKIVSLVI
ncbi:MAG: hypothetical protein WC307_01035 [Candidatus Nanoarchaeia archaeon]|jgi:hypothetical protein